MLSSLIQNFWFSSELIKTNKNSPPYVSGLNPDCKLLVVLQFVAVFYTAKQIHFRFQKSKTEFFFIRFS